MSRPPWRPSPGEEPWSDQCRIEPLAGWHLPLLGDPAFLPLHPVLQRALLLALPERLLQTIARRPSLAPQVLVAFAPRSQDALGLIVCRRLNRSGSCWQLQHLRTTPAADRRRLGAALLRAAIHRASGARSWIAQGSSLDPDRLALLREQGFQPLRTDQLWCWQPSGDPPAAATTSKSPSRRAGSTCWGGQPTCWCTAPPRCWAMGCGCAATRATGRARPGCSGSGPCSAASGC